MDDSRSAPEPTVRSRAREFDPLVGRVIHGRYTILNLIARGGMGKVYRAEQAPLGRQVAIKVLHTRQQLGESGEPDFQKRFLREASTASKLHHPNTVIIHDYGKTDDDVFYIAMELLEGRTLHRTLRDDGPLGPERTLHVTAQICRALREAHGHGVIHRDLKPANVFLVQHGDEPDFVKVLDFGLVKTLDEKSDQLTQTGLFMGSPKYMAPEQIRGEAVDARTDVYALGAMMCEMLTGKTPFDGPSSVSILMAHLNDEVPSFTSLNPDLEIPVELEQVARQCLAKQPNERFRSMDDLLRVLKTVGGLSLTTGDFPRARLPVDTLPPLHSAALEPANSNASDPPRALPRSAPFAQALRSSGTGVSLGLAALFALTGVAGLWVLGNARSTAPIEPTPAAASAPVQTSAALAPVEETPDGRMVLVSLRSTPPGAIVHVDDEQYGPTPTQVEWSGAAAAYGRVVKFRFERAGYRDVVVIRQVRGEQLEVHAPPLDPLPGARARRVRARADAR